jgi:hypothetical protein
VLDAKLMKFFWLISVMTALMFCPVRAQQITITLGEYQVSAGNEKWERGALDNFARGAGIFSADSSDIPMPVPGRTVTGATRGYYYQAEFTNVNGPKIKGIIWEYVFSDPGTKQEIGRQKFISRASIKKGKTNTLVGFKISPPS